MSNKFKHPWRTATLVGATAIDLLCTAQPSQSQYSAPSWDAYEQQCVPLSASVTIRDLAPIDCVSMTEITSMRFDGYGFSLRAARPEVQGFVAQVNTKLEQAKQGHRLTDAELAEIRSWRNNGARVETAIGYPPMPAVNSGNDLQLYKQWQRQSAIDGAFIDKALAYLNILDRAEMLTRADEKRATDSAVAESAHKKAVAVVVGIEKRAYKQCHGNFLEVQNLAAASPFAITGRCYRLQIIIISQWLDSKTALANLAMVPMLIDFSTPPDTQAMLGESIVQGEGAYQYQDAAGSLRTVPRVRLLAR